MGERKLGGVNWTGEKGSEKKLRWGVGLGLGGEGVLGGFGGGPKKIRKKSVGGGGPWESRRRSGDRREGYVNQKTKRKGKDKLHGICKGTKAFNLRSKRKTCLPSQGTF